MICLKILRIYTKTFVHLCDRQWDYFRKEENIISDVEQNVVSICNTLNIIKSEAQGYYGNIQGNLIEGCTEDLP